ATRAPTARTVAGAFVLRSTRIAPGAAPSSHAAATASITAGVGSAVNVTSLCRATSAAEPAATPPAWASARVRAASTSYPLTRCPSARRFAAIAPPMLPSPITPTRIAARYHDAARANKQTAAAQRLPGRHAQRAVQANRLAVQVRVLDDVAHERRVLGRPAEPRRKGDVRGERLALRFGQHREHGRVERPWRDRDHPDAERGQVAGDGQRHPHHPRLRGGIARLPDLPVEGRGRGGVDDHPAL